MKCPRCETAMLDEREREGVTIDACPQCRGIWLDRGELERLIARAVEEEDASVRRYRHDHEDDGDDHDHRERRLRTDERPDHDDGVSAGGHGRKRRWYDSLTNMFD
jgi:Zn-finger nucleic acid-binding protein